MENLANFSLYLYGTWCYTARKYKRKLVMKLISKQGSKLPKASRELK